MNRKTEQANRFILTGHGGFYNRGCEAIVLSTLDLLKAHWPNLAIILYSGDYDTDRTYNHANKYHLRRSGVKRYTLKWFINGILKQWPSLQGQVMKPFGGLYYGADACLSVGGDLYTFDYGFPGGRLERDKYLMSLGMPLVIWGASIGPFESARALKQIMIEHLASVDLITVRESVSVSYLRSLGITRQVVKVYDPAFSLKAFQVNAPEIDDLRGGEILGLNMSALIARWRSDNGVESLAKESARFIEKVSAAGLRVLLIPHVTNYSKQIGENDEAFLQMILQRVGENRESVRLIPSTYSAAELKWIISQCTYFIGARTHSTIAALSSGVPTISIAYSTKAKGINWDIFDCDKYVLETPMVSATTLCEKLRRLEKEDQSIRRLLRDKKPEMMMGAKRNVEALASLLSA